MRQLGKILLFFAISSLWAEPTIPPAIHWHTNYEVACALAWQTKLPLLLFFSDSHSALCRQLQEQLFTHSDWVTALRDQFIFVRLESDQADRQLWDHYGICGFPTFVLVGADRKKIGQTFYRCDLPKEHAHYLLSLLEKRQS